ncbi:AraC family transcriptional regulator [Microbispora sp. NPDC088329]|uniref:AraC family transcriptional regulator n=1 Tax=Microbispora sp. NPDC088329 TaxID=3154869 RepID=UPI003417E573
MRRVVDHITGHPDVDLSTAALAAGAGVSERHLTRLFLKHTGQAPGRFVRRARTEAAAQLLAATSLPMAAVAARCGFGTAETLRQAFVDLYGIPPSRYRLTQAGAQPRSSAPDTGEPGAEPGAGPATERRGGPTAGPTADEPVTVAD